MEATKSFNTHIAFKYYKTNKNVKHFGTESYKLYEYLRPH
jgi:hypothetical protein